MLGYLALQIASHWGFGLPFSYRDRKLDRRGLDAEVYSLQALVAGGVASSDLKIVHLEEVGAPEFHEMKIGESVLLEG